MGNIGAFLVLPLVQLQFESAKDLRRRRNERMRRAMDGDDDTLASLSAAEIAAVLEYRWLKEVSGD